MKVLLINPPYFNSKYKFIGLVAPPLGIAYIAAVLEENDIDVEIIDAAALEMSWEALETQIQKSNPGLVAVTALTPTISNSLKTAQLAKKNCPEATIVMGGYHPSFNHQEMLENDYVILWSLVKENILPQLVRTLEKVEILVKSKEIAYQDVITPPRL